MTRGRANAMARRGPFALALVASALLVVAPVALAQDDDTAVPSQNGVTVLQVDDRSAPPVAVLRSPAAVESVRVEVDGTEATGVSTTPLPAAGIAQRTVLVIDNSEESSRAGDLGALQAAAIDYVDGAPANEEIALVTMGGSAQRKSPFTTDRARTVAAIEALVGTGRTAAWDALQEAAGLVSTTSSSAPVESVRNIVVFAATPENASSVTAAAARGDVTLAYATTYPITTGAPNAGAYRSMALATGGTYSDAADSEAIGVAVDGVRNLVDNTYAVRFSAEPSAGGGSARFDVDGTSVEASYVAGSLTRGAVLAPTASSGGSGFLEGSSGLVLGIALGAVAAALLAWAVISLTQQEDDSLGHILGPYEEGGTATLATEKATGLRANLLFQRAVDITGNLAEGRGLLPRVEQRLEQADLPLRAAEALTFYAGGIGLGAVLGLLLGQTLITTVVGLLLGLVGPPMFLNIRASRRRKKFVSQLPDTLQLLSSTLKAGYSFMQGVEAVSREIEDPMGEELRRVVTEAQLGRALEDALDASAARMGSEDFEWAVMAVRIQREVGGNLSELLLTVAETMTARERLRREVSALTAEGRISAIVLGALPVGLALIMYVINPEYTGLLFSNSLGRIMLGVGVTAALIGFVWMKKIIDIRI